jgi:membrane protein DedA with SNARE-associated domain
MQGIIGWYIDLLTQFGLWGVMLFMAIESTVFPLPSELVVPPAAYLEYHERNGGALMAVMVIFAGTVGSYLGSLLMYVLARALGRPILFKYGKYFFLPQKKLLLAEQWVAQYGATGIFFGRLLPVVRHLISIPAGLCGLRFRTFTLMTLAGSFLWCTVLTLFGLAMADEMRTVLGAHGHLANEAQYEAAFHKLTWSTIALVGVVYAIYYVATRAQRRQIYDAEHTPVPAESEEA